MAFPPGPSWKPAPPAIPGTEPVRPFLPRTTRGWLVLVLLLLLMGVGAYNAQLGFRRLAGAVLASIRPEPGQARGLAPGAAPEIRKAVQERISGLRQRSHELPSCPLLFPLLDRQGKVTPVGSYLSYLGMKRASYLPEAVFRIPNIGDVFQQFELFAPGPRPLQENCRQELPFRFMAKDFGEGTWAETKAGFEITLRFWGTRPEQAYARTFAKDQLNLVPVWIAASIHGWTGFVATGAQAGFLASPIFMDGADLVRAAHQEQIFRNNPGLASGWDRILERNPGNAFVFDRWLSMTNWRQSGSQMERVAGRFKQSPRDALLRMDYAAELGHSERFQAAFELLADDLERDDDNSDLYDGAVTDLQKLKCHEESIQLLQLWCDKHPGNQEAWMALAKAYRAYAWVARGDGWASTVTPEGWRLLRERMAEAVKAATRSTEVAPRDCRTWATLMGMGTGAPLPPEKMAQCFAKVLETNPNHYPAYETYANFLKPKWFGDQEQVHAFVDRHADRFPLLTCDVLMEDFWDRDEARDEAGRRAHHAREADRVLHSPYLATYEQRMRAHLRAAPWDIRQWRYYMFWMVKIGKRDETLAFARATLDRADAELKAYVPTITLVALEYQADNLVNPVERAAFEGQPDVARLRDAALHELVAADPANWTAWNQLARFQVRRGRLKEARASFEQIGVHWVPSVWARAEFTKAQGQAAAGAPAA